MNRPLFFTLFLFAVSMDGFTAGSGFLDVPIESRDSDGNTAVWYALEDDAALRLLVDRGARFDVVNNLGHSPLEASVQNKLKADAFRTILEWEQKHSPGFSGSWESRGEYLASIIPPMLDSFKEVPADCIKMLFDAGADLFTLLAHTPDGSVMDVFFRPYYFNYLMLLPHGLPVNILDKQEETLLMCAAREADAAAVQKLLDAGADPNIRDIPGNTALMNVCQNRSAETETVILMLLDAGADASLKNNIGDTALHGGYFLGRDAILRLLEAGAGINAVNDEGYTPFMRTVLINMEDGDLAAEMEKLIGLGADPLVMLPWKQTLLHYYLQSAWSWSFDVIKILLDSGMDPTAQDIDGDSALFQFYMKTNQDNRNENHDRILDMMLSVSDEEKAAHIKMQAERKKRSDFFGKLPMALLVFSVLYIGLSIGCREKICRNNHGSNLMVPVNIFTITFSIISGICVLLGFLLLVVFLKGYVSFEVSYLLLCALAGGIPLAVIAGIMVVRKTAVRNVFVQSRFLYYLPSVVLAITAAAVIYRRFL